jgi:hypothetical protein
LSFVFVRLNLVSIIASLFVTDSVDEPLYCTSSGFTSVSTEVNADGVLTLCDITFLSIPELGRIITIANIAIKTPTVT